MEHMQQELKGMSVSAELTERPKGSLMLAICLGVAAVAWMLGMPTQNLDTVSLAGWSAIAILCATGATFAATPYTIRVQDSGVSVRHTMFRKESFPKERLVDVTLSEHLAGFRYRRYGWNNYVGRERFIGLSSGKFLTCTFSDGRTLIIRSTQIGVLLDGFELLGTEVQEAPEPDAPGR